MKKNPLQNKILIEQTDIILKPDYFNKIFRNISKIVVPILYSLTVK